MESWLREADFNMIDYEKLKQSYFQQDYDFTINALSNKEIEEIKRLAREKRVDYGQAPLGNRIFDLIASNEKDIRFEKAAFDAERIDGLLYIPAAHGNTAYIIINCNKPLVNQIFTAAHEYYHYIVDYRNVIKEPYICDLTDLGKPNERKASRFAAELLLPEEALKKEIADALIKLDIYDIANADIGYYAAIVIWLMDKYQLPLKAVMYRLAEEGYIDNIDGYIDNYEFIKMLAKKISVVSPRVSELFSNDNNYITPIDSVYDHMEKAFKDGNASAEKIIEDAGKLELNMDLINDFLNKDEEFIEEDDLDDDKLFEMINAK